MRRRLDFDDEEARANWPWRLAKGVVAGAVVSVTAAAALSIFVLPPPAPLPPPQSSEATAGAGGEPTVIDGIEVSSEPAYSGTASAATDPFAEADAPMQLSGPALVVNAEPFAAEPDMPLVSVVLGDAGANPLLHEMLFSLGMPVTIGVVAGAPGDEVTARQARAAGLEVVAELPLAQPGASEGAALEYGLPAGEAAERTQLLMRRLPMAVAATPGGDAPLPPDAGVLGGMLDALGPLGFAYLERGLAPGQSPDLASDGLERIVAVSRFAVPPGASAAEAHAVLDRAAAEAAETGAAVVMAAAEEQVLLAVQLWGGEGVDGMAYLAPLSAVIRRQNGGDALPEGIASGDVPEVAPEAAPDPDAVVAPDAGTGPTD